MTFPSGDTFEGTYEKSGDTSLRQGESSQVNSRAGDLACVQPFRPPPRLANYNDNAFVFSDLPPPQKLKFFYVNNARTRTRRSHTSTHKHIYLMR